jgi:hypothetical protein
MITHDIGREESLGGQSVDGDRWCGFEGGFANVSKKLFEIEPLRLGDAERSIAKRSPPQH